MNINKLLILDLVVILSLKSIWSDISIAIPDFFSSWFARYNFSIL